MNPAPPAPPPPSPAPPATAVPIAAAAQPQPQPAALAPAPILANRSPLAVDVFEAARLLSVNPATVRREISRGNLRAVRIGRVFRVRVAELQVYLQDLERQLLEAHAQARAAKESQKTSSILPAAK